MPDNTVYAKVPEFDQHTEMVLQLNPIINKDSKYYPCIVVRVVPDVEISKGDFQASPLAPKLSLIVDKDGTYDKAALLTAKCVIRETVEIIDEKPIEDFAEEIKIIK